MPIDITEMVRVVGIQLSALRSGGALPAELYEGARIESAGTEVYDINGELLFHRVPIRRGSRQVAFTDIAAHVLASVLTIDTNPPPASTASARGKGPKRRLAR